MTEPPIASNPPGSFASPDPEYSANPPTFADPATSPNPAAAPPTPAYPAPPTYPAPPAYPTPPYPPSGAGYGGYGYGYPPQPGPYYPVYAPPAKTNGMAIASLAVSIVSVGLLACYGVGGLVGVVGAILGHVARRQINSRGEGGSGMALAGIIVGWVVFGLGVILVGLLVYFISTTLNAPTSVTNT
jgi:uncharacterized protein DUF4190